MQFLAFVKCCNIRLLKFNQDNFASYSTILEGIIIKELLSVKNLSIKPLEICLYVPPIVWKGDAVGHIGENDLFFLVLEGECFLSIDSENYIIKPGQLAYLPKGKRRAYTHISKRFSMYEMAFSATCDGKSLMELLDLTDDNFIVTIADIQKISALFESSHRKELYKNPLYDIGWCANIINIIRMYATERQKQSGEESQFFKPVLDYMSSNYDKPLKTEDLSSLVHMQTTYFIKRFKKNYGLPPMAYFNRMKMYKAMGMLSGTDLTIEQIAKKIGITDTSYFARVFKKYCNTTPSQYRAEFKKSI